MYRAACLAQPSAVLYPEAVAATFRDAPARADPDASPSAANLAVVQMVLVALLVRRPILPVHPTVKDTFVLALQASDASVDPDAVRLAAGRPAQCPAAVRDYLPSASVDAPVPKVASSFQELPPLDAPSKVVFPCLVQPLDPDVAWVAWVPLTAGAPELHLEQNSPENLEPKAARQVP